MLDEWLGRRAERFKYRIILTTIVLFMVSMVMSCQELRYMVSGKVIDATLVGDKVEITKDEYGNTSHQRVIHYMFMDKETARREYARVDDDYPHPEGTTVKVQYIAGHDLQSRLMGQHHYGWVIGFVASLVAMVAAVLIIGRST